MKFVGWVIISIHWFKPIKKKLNHSKIFRERYKGESRHGLNLFGLNKTNKLIRLKILLYIFTKLVNGQNKEYVF